MELVKIESQVAIGRTGWDLSGITEKQWNEAGQFLVEVDQARQWWLGDWWNACQWGTGRAACERLGINYETAKRCGAVARTFELWRRIHNLGFYHHMAVCPIDDPAEQDRLLDWAEKEGATVKALREKVKAFLKPEPEPATEPEAETALQSPECEPEKAAEKQTAKEQPEAGTDKNGREDQKNKGWFEAIIAPFQIEFVSRQYLYKERTDLGILKEMASESGVPVKTLKTWMPKGRE